MFSWWNFSKDRAKLGFIILTLITLATGCSGGDDDPPRPAPGADSKTLTGEFISPNGLRTEVDKALAKSFGSNPPLLKSARDLAIFYQSWFTKIPQTEAEARSIVLEEARLSRCVYRNAATTLQGSEAELEVQLRTFNTVARQNIRAELYALGGAFDLPETSGTCES